MGVGKYVVTLAVNIIKTVYTTKECDVRRSSSHVLKIPCLLMVAPEKTVRKCL